MLLNGIKTVEDIANNTDVNYTEVNYSANIDPTNNETPKKKRYIPLVGSFSDKYRNKNNSNNGNSDSVESSEIRYNSYTNNYVTVYYQTNTKNESFMNMHYYLKAKGIKNNKFHLLLYDKDLLYVDPYDPLLPMYMKQKIFVECQRNFWYYCREVVRVQSQGGPYVRYRLDRGNLALNFCFTLNLNMYMEQPRQTGKTVGTEVWFSWVYNFGSRNANMVFLNKKHDDAKRNLNDLKQLIKALPSYLRFDQVFGQDGKKLKATNTIQYLQHKINFNKIEALPMARNRTAAISLLRGRTITNCWFDESAFFQYFEETLQNAMPALTRAFQNCKENGAPHGLCLTSTPGFLTEECGKFMYDLKCKMTPFTELWYDFSLQQLNDTLQANEKSIFVYIRTTYKQLGYSEQWLKDRIREQNEKWSDIRREFLLEWATSSENCPFSQEQLRNVQRFTRNPIKQVYIDKYIFNIYEELNPKVNPIIGVDVAAGYSRDSSAISVIDPTTTRLVADFNCNYINPVDLGKVIYELVTIHMPNALVVIERNGVGTGTLAKLMKSKVRKNLYYEIKERTIEERPNGFKANKRKQLTKVYGVDNSKEVREQLMDLLTDRVEDHYDKIISPILYEELKNLEVKKTGKIDHSVNSHDDSIFSYLYSLYPLYYGKNVKENWNISIPTIKTADDEAEEIFQDFEATENLGIIKELENIDSDDYVKEQVQYLLKGNIKLYQDFINSQKAENDEAMKNILSSKLGQEAYARQYNMPIDAVREQTDNQYNMLGVIEGFYSEDNNLYNDKNQK